MSEAPEIFLLLFPGISSPFLLPLRRTRDLEPPDEGDDACKTPERKGCHALTLCHHLYFFFLNMILLFVIGRHARGSAWIHRTLDKSARGTDLGMVENKITHYHKVKLFI